MQKIISNSTIKGETLEEEVCNQEVVGYDKVEKTREVWNEYNFETLKAGEYEWKIIGSKATSQSVDFIPVAHGKSLNEWAWWNNDWEFKREITNLSLGYAIFDIVYNENMNNDFSDLRFVNSSETAELPYWIERKTNGVSARIRVQTGENSIYMYYGNNEATSISSIKNLYGDDNIIFYNFDETSGTTLINRVDGTINGALNGGVSLNQAGKINNSFYFDGTDDFVALGTIKLNSNVGATFSYWFYNSGTETGEHQGLIDGTWDGLTSYVNNANSMTIRNTAFNNVPINAGWNHIVLIYNTTSVKIYKNGEYYNQGANSKFPSGNLRYTIGAHSDGGGRYYYYKGNIDEILIFNNTISDSQALALYNVSENTAIFGAEERTEGVSITLNSPADELNISSSSINFNATITPTDATIKNITLYLNGEEYLDLYDTNETIDYFKTLELEDGSYTWNITACWIGVSEAENCKESETRTFEIDSVAPNLTLNAPLTNFTTLTLPINVTLNFTASDSNLDSCWFSSSMNGTNTTFTCNTTQTIAFNSSGAHSFTYYANDTFGGVSTGTAPFYVYYITRNATATSPITEGGISSHSFYLNMTNVANFNATAELYWNGTSYGLGTKTILSNDSLRFDKNIIVPSINGTSVNWTWVYNISGNPNVTNYNLTGSQNYIKVNITECGAGTYQILNYTLYDQETRALGSTANASIEVDLTLTSQANDSLSWQYHATKTSSTSFLICLPSGALNNSAYDLDSVSKYTYQDHVLQYHYIENFNLTKSSIPQTIKLYPLATAKSTSFLVNYQDENYIYVENAVIDVWRRYIGDGVFFSVEHGKTDANGQTRLHLVTEDIIYKFLVWQDGELVYTSPEFLALCQATPCQINLRQSTDETDGFSERDNLIYDYDFNKTTRTASFTFATKDNTQTEINMTILSSNQYANETACTTSLTASGGQIDCVIPTAFTNTSYQTIIYQDGQYFGTAFDSLAPSSMEIFGYTGLILTAIAYLMLALMGISSGIATIIFGIIGLVLMGIIQIFESGNVFGMASAIIWLIVAGIIIIIKITKRRIQ
jgi:hypothetical protein